MFCFEKYVRKKKQGYILIYVYILGIFLSALSMKIILKDLEFYKYVLIEEKKLSETMDYEKNNEIILSKINSLIKENTGVESKNIAIELINTNKETLKIDKENYIEVLGDKLQVNLKYKKRVAIRYIYDMEIKGEIFKYRLLNWEFINI